MSSEGEVQEEVWLYRVMERYKRPIRYETSGATVWIVTGTRESRVRFAAGTCDRISVCLLSVCLEFCLIWIDSTVVKLIYEENITKCIY